MCKMQLAELNENHLGTCHELHKSREKNLAIAGKMTRSAHLLLLTTTTLFLCKTASWNTCFGHTGMSALLCRPCSLPLKAAALQLSVCWSWSR